MIRSIPNSETGAAAILVAVAMLALMGFSAIVVDVGAGFNERRQDQSGADAAVLGGALEFVVNTTSPNVLQAAVDEAKALVNANLADPVAPAEWAACTDADALPYPSNDPLLGIANGTACISFGPNEDGTAFARLRVRIPDRTVSTTFARFLGIDSLTTSAAAEATLENSGAIGAFPAAVFNGSAAGDQFCIKTGASNASACGDPTTGDFGNFRPYFYTDIAPGAGTECDSGEQKLPLSYSMANGIDHFLGVTPGIPGARENGDNCPAFPGPVMPNRVDSGAGYTPDDITWGLVQGNTYGGVAFDGRLHQSLWDTTTYGLTEVFSEQLDNRPLWTYIDPAALGPLPGNHVCRDAENGPSKRSDDPAAFDQAQLDIVDCLKDPLVPKPLFADAIFDTARLTIVPMYHQNLPLPSNSCCYDIKDFVPAFLEAIWVPSSPPLVCTGEIEVVPGDYCKHEPGRDGTIVVGAPGIQRVSSASATVLSCELLPGEDPPAERCKRIDSGGGNTATVFIDLELTR